MTCVRRMLLASGLGVIMLLIVIPLAVFLISQELMGTAVGILMIGMYFGDLAVLSPIIYVVVRKLAKRQEGIDLPSVKQIRSLINNEFAP